MNGLMVRAGRLRFSQSRHHPPPHAALSQQADRPDRAVRRRRHYRHGGAADRAAHDQPMGPDGGVHNRPGGGGTIGTTIVAKAAPDGHTLLVSTIAFAISASLTKTSYDAIKDFTPITEVVSIPLMLVVHPSLPVTNLKEFIAYTKAQPNGLDYASSGAGTSPHLAAEMFKSMSGANLVHVPVKGNAEVLYALLGGHVKVHFGLTSSTLQHVRTGALRVIAATTEKRIPSLPEVPTIAELGYPDYEISSWQAMFAPAGTPKDVIAKINAETGKMLAEPAVRERISKEGADPVGSSPANSTSASAARSRSGPRWSRIPGSRRNRTRRAGA